MIEYTFTSKKNSININKYSFEININDKTRNEDNKFIRTQVINEKESPYFVHNKISVNFDYTLLLYPLWVVASNRMVSPGLFKGLQNKHLSSDNKGKYVR